MPEFPDIEIYIEALRERISGRPVRAVRIAHPFLLRTVEPTPSTLENQPVTDVRRIGKRIAIGAENDVWMVIHLMIAGRLHWHEANAALKRRTEIAALDFDNGSLVMTEAGTKKRASIHIVSGEEGLAEHDPRGLEIFAADLAAFRERLTLRNHTLKRALTDPRLFSGIGNAYSDEILHRAQLSPIAHTQKLDGDEIERLYHAVRDTLTEWTARLREESAGEFPKKVTAFRDGMAVHGRYGSPCPVCEAPVQRIRYASNETNYCARCQTGGKVLADRVLSRLLKKDWPQTLEELEELRGE